MKQIPGRMSDIIIRIQVRGKPFWIRYAKFTEKICRLYYTDFLVGRNLLADLLIGVRTELSRGALIRRNFGIIPKTAEN